MGRIEGPLPICNAVSRLKHPILSRLQREPPPFEASSTDGTPICLDYKFGSEGAGGGVSFREAIRQKKMRKEARAIARAHNMNESRKNWARQNKPTFSFEGGNIQYKIAYEPRKRGSDWRIH
jgi:hypothetical protein